MKIDRKGIFCLAGDKVKMKGEFYLRGFLVVTEKQLKVLINSNLINVL